MGLKGLQIEQTAHEVMAYCAALQKDFGKFRDDFELVGTHLSRAQSKYADVGQAARPLRDEARPGGRPRGRGSSRAEPPALPRALDAA